MSDLESDNLVFFFGVPPLRVDILTDISGVAFEEAWASRLEGSLAGVPVCHIGHKDFIANKRTSGRAKHLAAIEALEGFGNA